MRRAPFKSNPFEMKVKVFLEPITGQFNIFPFHGGVSSMDDVDTKIIINKYKKRFKEAWEELSEK
ncbi:MAG: hypothetical protein PHU44_12010 [Syntrophales bacterium]|nr:hypothetical protein [Syntrophales bacterium]MDD5641546.1 hypothetical protein [Syntrophales bacterium]